MRPERSWQPGGGGTTGTGTGGPGGGGGGGATGTGRGIGGGGVTAGAGVHYQCCKATRRRRWRSLGKGALGPQRFFMEWKRSAVEGDSLRLGPRTTALEHHFS
eukprot:567463-Rhodomonas_salina.1